MVIKLIPDRATLENLKTFDDMFTRKELNHAAAEGAEVIAEEARRIVPVKTGKLKRNIVVKQNKRNTRPNAFVGINYSRTGGAPYAHIVEWGNATNKAHPFIRPAATRKQSEVGKVIEASLLKQSLKRLN